MKTGILAAVFASLSASAVCSALNPVTRVVELLQGLSTQITEEAKQEEALYNAFVCWGTSILRQKAETNAAANARIEELTTYVRDLDAGRIELTTERVDLEKEIKTLKDDIDTATALRNKERSEFEDAKLEMEKGIAALTQAIEILKTATAEHKEGVLMSLKTTLSETAEVRAQESMALNLAVSLGKKTLSAGDAIFLQRVLLGEVPTADWKKLNREATFKMNYKARSFEIQSALEKLLESFESNLKEASEKESTAQGDFDELSVTKGDELKTSQDALAKLEKENGARGLSRDEATSEIGDLQKQVADDTGYMTSVKDALTVKKNEWKDRKTLREGELAAISKAIAILHSDDARDTFKRSFASQEGSMSLLQVTSGSRASAQRRSAVETLRAAAQRSSDKRLLALSARIASMSGGHFDDVIAAIDSMLILLQAEEDKDLKTKEDCEKTRADDTRAAILASRTIDEHTEAIMVLVAKIEELRKDIEAKQAQVEVIKGQLVEAEANRDKEHKEYLVAKKDDEDAATLILSAKAVLEQFYTENHLMLVQGTKVAKQTPYETAAGQAPPPPPPTWEVPGYAGKTDEQTGIVAILGLVHEDVVKDIAKAQAEEDASLALYQKTKLALETERDDLIDAIGVLSSSKADAEQDVQDHKGERRTKTGELGVVMQKIKDAEPGCAYFQVNYPLRVANRQLEIDGLHKAKDILQGATFSNLDPNREMKPGDALLQQRSRLVPISRRSA